jgi:PST family polysaccharide transporter
MMWRGIQILAKQGITFLIFIICSRLLDPYLFGIYNYVIAIIFLLIIFSDFGISSATSKYVAEYNSTNPEKLKSVLFSSATLIISLSILVSLVVIIFGKPYLNDKYVYVLCLLPIILFAPLTSLYDGILIGLKKFKKLSIITTIIGSISIIFIYYLISKYELFGALIAQNIYYILLFLSLAFSYRGHERRIDRSIMRDIGNYSLIIGIASIGLLIYGRIDVIFLGHYNYIIEIDYYEIVNKMLLIILTPFTIIAQVIAPDIVKYFARKEYTKIRNKFVKYILLSLCLATIITILFGLSKNFIIANLFPDYNNQTVSYIFNIMLIAFFTQMLNGIIPRGFVYATGHAKLSANFLIIFGIIHIFMNYFFINEFGYIGIIYSFIITRVVADLSFIFTYWLILKKYE